MSEIPIIEPEKIIAGFSVKWKKYYADYLPDDGWTLKYTLKQTDSPTIQFSSSADGDYHLISLTPSDTQNYTSGKYEYQAYVESSGGEKFIVGQGRIEIVPDYTQSNPSYDPRSHARKCLDAINAVIEGRATANQASVKVGDKELRYFKFSELLELKSYYEAQVEAEEKENALNNGETVNNALYAEFSQI